MQQTYVDSGEDAVIGEIITNELARIIHGTA